MESLLLSASARVLIIDASSESREILRTLLARQGTKTLETSQIQAASRIAQRQQPDLIVYDADGDRSPQHEATRNLAQQASRSDIPIVVLGTAKRELSPLVGGRCGSQTLPLRTINP